MNHGSSCIIGTPVYMSPEFIKGQCKQPADIWSLGCTIFELITGLPPWHHTGVRDHLPLMFYITTTSESPLVFPKDEQREFSEDFINFMEKCFERDPMKRPSAKELLKHPWVAATASGEITQQEIEEVTVAQSVELCTTLSTEPLVAGRELESCSSTPRASDCRELTEASASAELSPRLLSVHNSPKPRFGSSATNSPQHLDFSQCGALSQSAGQYLLLNQEKGELEFADAAGESGDLELPTIIEPPTPLGSESLARSTSVTTRHLRRGSSVSFLPDPDAAPSSPSSALVPSSSLTTMHLEGPVRMSFSFRAGGSRVSVGLDIQPEDVTCRMVDRRPSFVVAMNDHIKGQLTSAMNQLCCTRR